MFYNFKINRATPFTTRRQAINEFAAGRRFLLINNRRVDANEWDNWVTRQALNQSHLPDRRVRVNSVLTGNRYEVAGNWKYDYTGLFKTNLAPNLLHNDPENIRSIQLSNQPNSDKDRKAAVKDKIIADFKYFGEKSPQNPLPGYERYGYESMQDFMDGWDWHFNWVKNKSELNYSPTRNEYTVEQPIVDPKDDTLLMNFFATRNPPAFPVNMIREDDPHLFETV